MKRTEKAECACREGEEPTVDLEDVTIVCDRSLGDMEVY